MDNLMTKELNFVKSRMITNKKVFSNEEQMLITNNIKCISKVYKIGYLDGKK